MNLDFIKNNTWMLITFLLGGIVLSSAISTNIKSPSSTIELKEPFLGEVSIFTSDFAPRGWAICDGQLLSVSQNQNLFSLLGTTYGGDGTSTFGLPNLIGRVAIHTDQKKIINGNQSVYAFGEKGGVEKVSAITKQVASPSQANSGVYVIKANNNSNIDNRQPSLGVNYIIAIDENFRYPSQY